MSVTVNELITLAQAALDTSLSVEESIAKIELYTSAFSSLQDENSSLPDGLDEEQLKELQGLHTAILRKANVLHQGTSSDLKSLHQKGRGLMSYIDVLPKSISVRRSRKG